MPAKCAAINLQKYINIWAIRNVYAKINAKFTQKT